MDINRLLVDRIEKEECIGPCFGMVNFPVPASGCFHDCFAGSVPRRGSWSDSSNDSPASFSIGMPEARDSFSASTNLSTFHSLIHQ